MQQVLHFETIDVYRLNYLKNLKKAIRKTLNLLLPVFFILCVFAFSQNAVGQTSGQYTFSTVATGSLALDRNGNTIDMSTGTTQLVGASTDDGVSPITNIGFNFTFMSTGGTNNIFTQFSASSNGVIRLGATAVESDLYGNAFPVSGQAIIAPYLQDQETNSTGKVHYKLFGTYPNRTLVVEFLNIRINYNSTSADGTYQVRLYEQSNIIEFVYGAMKVGSISASGSTAAAARTVSIGFCNTTGANNQFSVNQSTYATSTSATVITNNNNSTGTITGLNSTADGSRRVFTFIPTVAYKSQFISMSTGSTTWCTGETRNVTVTIKNIGTATWTTASPVINIGARFNANADYDYRVSAAGLAPGAQATYTIPITAPATASSTENISFDVVKEGACWFRDNIAGCAGPGNMNFVGPTQTIVASTPISISYSTNPATYCANVAITNNSPVISGGTPTAYSVSPALPAGLSLNTSTGVISGTPTTATPAADYIVTASNNCTSKTIAVNITISPAAPSALSYTSNTVSYCLGTAIANNSPSNSGGAPTLYSVTPALPAGLSLNTTTGVISGTPTAASAAANYTITASNSCGSTTKAVNITVTTAPVTVTYSTNPAVYCPNAAIINNTPTTTSGGAPTLYAVAPALPAGLSFNTSTGVISGTPTTTTAAANYTVTASNSCGSTTVVVNITISPAAPSALSYTSNTAIYCIGTAIANNSPSSSGGAPTSYSVSPALPAGLSLNTTTGIISGTPTAVSAAANYTVTASNSCGSTTKAVNITVTTAPVTLTYSTNPAIYCPGSAITNNTPTTGGGAPTSYTVSPSLPAGLSINATTGVISGTPTTSTAAANYTVTASNSCGSTTVAVNITVSPAAPSALSYTLSTAAYCPGSAIASNSPSNSGGTPTSYSVNPALPAGLSLNTTTGVISGTPTTSTPAANYTVTASNSCGSTTKAINITINAQPASLTVSPTSSTICNGGNVTLTAGASSSSIGSLYSEDFDGTSTFTATGTTSGNRTQIFEQETSGTSVNSAGTFTSPNGGKLIVSTVGASSIIGASSVSTTLTSPLITGFSSLSTLTFNHTYKQGNSSGSGIVQISIDGGSTWSTLTTYSSNQGSSSSFVAANLSLTTYSSATSILIRFNFASANQNAFSNTYSWWAIDDVEINGVPLPLFSWTASPSGTTAGLPSGAGTFSSTNKTITVNPTASTVYTVTAQDAVSGCTSTTTASSTITVNQKSAAPTSASASVTTICNGSSTVLTLNGGGGGTGEVIKWYTGSCGGTAAGTGNNLTVSPTATTTYYGRYEDGAPCSFNTTCATITITVNQKSANPTSATASATTICNGQSTLLTLNGGGNGTGQVIHWYSGSCAGISVGTGNGLSVSPTVTTTYYGRYEDGTPCSFNTTCASVTVTVNQTSANPTSATATATNICNGQSTTLTLNGGGGGTGEVIHWYSGSCGGTSAGTGNNLSVSPATTTTYFGRYEDAAPCSFNTACAQVTINVTPQPSAMISYAGSPYCSGNGTATVTRTGTAGGTYSSTPGLSINTTTGTVDIGASASGTYTVTYTVGASGGCSIYTTTTTITINSDTWTGETSRAWDVATNWSCGVPTSTTDVLIPSGLTNYPLVPGNGTTYAVRGVTIASGASLTTAVPAGNAQGILNISGAFSNSGTLSDSGKIILSGSVAQDFPGSQSAIITPMNELEVNKTTGGAVTISKSFTINTTLIPTSGIINLGTGNITLHSGQNYTAAVSAVGANASISYSDTGRFVVERFFPLAATRGYRLMTAPISSNGTTSHTILTDWQNNKVYTPGIGEFITGPADADPASGLDIYRNYSLKRYDSSAGVFMDVLRTDVPLSTADFGGTTPANVGYFNFVRGDRDPKNLNTNYKNTTTLSATGKLQTGTKIFNTPGGNNAFILVGNPYASPVNFGTLGKNNISDQFWAYDARLNGGAYVNVSAIDNPGTYVQVPTTMSAQTQHIQSSQAVFVRSEDSTQAASVTFTESDKSTTSTPLVFRPSAIATSSLTTNLYLVNTDNTTDLADGTLSLYNDNYSNGVDYNDGAKFTNTNEMLAIRRDTKLLSVERRKTITSDDTLFFSLTKSKQHGYKFEFIPTGLGGNTAFLVDAYLKTSTPLDMTATSTVSFTINADAASGASDRFMIVFRPTAALPISFTNVKAYQQGSNINVEWTISNEKNMSSYEVERSTDGRTFSKSTALVATRNNGTTAAYAWPDASPVNGANYYRIKSISKTGEIQYSSIVKVTTGNGKPMIAVYPNPVTGGVINLQLMNQPAGKYNIRLLDKIGQVVMAKQANHTEGSSTETLQISKAMAHGSYQLEVSKPDNSRTVINVLY